MFKKYFLAISLFFSLNSNSMFQDTIANVTKKQLPRKEVIHEILTKHLGCSDGININTISDELAHQELTKSEIDTKLHNWYFGLIELYFPKLSEIATEIYGQSK